MASWSPEEHEAHRQKRERARILQRVDIRDLGDIPPAPEFAVEPLIPYDTVTLLAAHGGAGKSILALTIAAHYAVGKRWCNLHVGAGPALFVSLEDPADVVRWRLRKVCREHRLEPAAVAERLMILDGTAGDGSLVSEINEHGIRRLAETAAMVELIEATHGAGLIVIDNASDAYDGDENARRQVRTFMRRLGQIARENHAGVLLLAHIDKNAAKFGAAGNSYSGSTAWHNSARSRLALVNTESAIELRQEKLNLGKPSLPITLAWSDNGVLIHDTTIRTAAAENTAQTEYDDEQAILAALTAAAAAGVNVSAARTGPTNTLVALRTFDLPRWVRNKGGSERFWQVINRLQASGRIEVQEYKNAARQTKARLVLRQFGAIAISPHPYATGTVATIAVPDVRSSCDSSSRTIATVATVAGGLDDAA